MTRRSIVVCQNPCRTEWQLGRLPPATGRMTLIGWKYEPDSIDSGIPEEVAAVLARALTSVGRVTFLSSAAHVALVSTTDPRTTMSAFDDPDYPWWMQGQVLLLTASKADPPDIDRNHLLALFDEGWTAKAAALARFGVLGIVRPGVDGDVAGLLTLAEGVEEVSLAALEREARLASFEWSVVTEEHLLA